MTAPADVPARSLLNAANSAFNVLDHHIRNLGYGAMFGLTPPAEEVLAAKAARLEWLSLSSLAREEMPR